MIEIKVCEIKKEKKTEHTRIVAQPCSSTSTIFTSVVVYSRTTHKNKKQQYNKSCCRPALFILLLEEIICLFLKKKRKKRSTHACTHNCAARRAKYSRRLLSILARPHQINYVKVTSGSIMLPLLYIVGR